MPRLNRIIITEVMKSRSAVFGSSSETHAKHGKIEHGNGQNFDPR